MSNTGIKMAAAETAAGALSVAGPQPVWMTLDEARERAFTGQVVFEVDPEVSAYLDHGIVYYAERTSDAPLGYRLLEAGVVDAAQLEHGTVRVGDVEHLGRLFDREPSVDRDAVLVATETWTEDLVAELANQAVTTVRVTAYRHHRSGVHRWFVAQATPSRPVGSLNELDATGVEELRGFSVVDDEVLIEWDQLDEVVPCDDVEQVEMPVEEQPSDDVEAFDPPFTMPAEPGVEEPALDFEFEFTWPDGTKHVVDADAPFAVENPVAAEKPAVTETDDGGLYFEMPELDLGAHDAVAVDEVSEDVEAAVRRAIAAIESTSVEYLNVSVEVDTFDADLAAEPAHEAPDPAGSAPEPVAPGPGAFAPPTMETRAEVMYARAEEAAAEPQAASQPGLSAPALQPSLPTQDATSVAFLDDEPDEGGSGRDRSSALRRLIGGLRR